MADFQNIKLKSYSESSRGDIDKFVYDVAFDDLLTTLRYVAATEIKEQIDIGNTPTNILVDNRSGTYRSIDAAQKRVQAFFADTNEILAALDEAWVEVRKLTPVYTGRSIASYQIWYNNTVIGNNPTAARQFAARFNPAKDQFRIVGPVLIYGRKVYWNPNGKVRLKKITVFRSKALVVKKIRIRGIMDLAAKKVQARHKSIQVAEAWVLTGALPKDGRTPAIVLSYRKKGSLFR